MENRKYFGIIYKVTNKVNGKVYIGQTIQSFYKRKWSHESRAKNSTDNMPFHTALCKYGKSNFEWEIIEYCDSKEELDEMEFHYILQFNTLSSDGYNCTYGGEGNHGFKHSKETCELIRQMKTGVKLSKESIAKRSQKQSYTWKIIFPDDKEEIICNLSDFCRKNNLCATSMSAVARGDRSHHKGFKCIKLSKRKKINSKSTRLAISKANKGRKLTPEQLKQRIESQAYYWEITLLKSGDKIQVKNLKEYCRKNDIHYHSMLKVSSGAKKHHKGLECIKVME